MAKNVTLKLDDAVLRKARHLAVEQNSSLSQWLTDLILEQVSGRPGYAAARRRAVKRLDAGLRLGGKPLTRDQAHKR
jgi:predicted transcriptional regulator